MASEKSRPSLEQEMGWFSEIPPHNQLDILKKLDFKEYAKFKQCSKETLEITRDFKHGLVLKVDYINFYPDVTDMGILPGHYKKCSFDGLVDEPIRRVEAVELSVASLYSQGVRLEDFCTKWKLKMERMELYTEREADSEHLAKVIKLTNLKTLHVIFYFPLDHPELRKIDEIHIFGMELGEPAFLLLENPKIYLTNNANLSVSMYSVNRFLKQWDEGHRRIEILDIRPVPSGDIFADLNPTLLDTPDVGDVFKGPPPLTLMNVCSMTRRDGKKLFIAIFRVEHRFDWRNIRIIIGECDHDDVKSWILSLSQ